MKINNYTEYMQELLKIVNETRTINKSIKDDPNCDINDWCAMHRMDNFLVEHRYHVEVYADFSILMHDMETEKDRFQVQKIAKYHTDQFIENIDLLIEICHTWDMSDYRCRSLFKRIEELVMAGKDFWFNL